MSVTSLIIIPPIQYLSPSYFVFMRCDCPSVYSDTIAIISEGLSVQLSDEDKMLLECIISIAKLFNFDHHFSGQILKTAPAFKILSVFGGMTDVKLEA